MTLEREIRQEPEPTDYQASYQRLRADLQAARDKIGDTPMPSAGFTAVALLENVLQRHPAKPREGQPS